MLGSRCPCRPATAAGPPRCVASGRSGDTGAGPVPSGAGVAPAEDAYTALKSRVQRLASRRRDSNGTITIHDPDSGTVIVLDPELPDEAYRQLPHVDPTTNGGALGGTSAGRAPALCRLGRVCRESPLVGVGSRASTTSGDLQVSMPEDLSRSRARVGIFPDQPCR
jgi:hypothetical protein